ncbi:MAG: DNA polymerase domain-containing protein [Promethearchaeota archaeon]
MRHRGWLLDPHIQGKYAILWLRTEPGRVLRLMDRHQPVFIAAPKEGNRPEDVRWLFEQHPFVNSSKIVEKYPTLRREQLKKVVEVKVDMEDDLDNVLKYAERLQEVQEVYNTGLIAIQWHMIHRGIQPSSLCEIKENNGKILSIQKMDDREKLEPPPFKVNVIRIPDTNRIEKIEVFDGWHEKHVTSFKGKETEVLQGFQCFLIDEDPDMLVTCTPVTTIKNIVRRANRNKLDFRFGREGERYNGRILVGYSSYMNYGVAGLVERARYTYAPMGVSADWEPGKTIDSQQCAHAVRLGVMVPKMKGGFGFSSTAWDMVKSDRGGMVFSPKPGLHENVAALDFESMFPNIIIRKNVSYETVTEEGIDHSIPGFMGGFTEPIVKRRLRLKHLRNTFHRESNEWWWCQQRQSSLKMSLVVTYGYSGCYANRFANVRVFQEINRQARTAMVQALKTAQDNGYEVIYGPFDSLFVKKRGATRQDYTDLAAEITEVTSLPMSLDRHFKFLVLLTKTTDPIMMAANRYYGKLMDGSMFYRGIELRRHDTPPYINTMQKTMMNTMFDAEDVNQIYNEGIPSALNIAHQALRNIKLGKVNPHELIISKRLRRDLTEYRSRQPHIVAAMLGTDTEISKYVLVNVESPNPFTRVIPAENLDDTHKAYDKKKYAQLVRRAAWNLLRPFVPEESYIGGSRLRESQLDIYF